MAARKRTGGQPEGRFKLQRAGQRKAYYCRPMGASPGRRPASPSSPQMASSVVLLAGELGARHRHVFIVVDVHFALQPLRERGARAAGVHCLFAATER